MTTTCKGCGCALPAGYEDCDGDNHHTQRVDIFTQLEEIAGHKLTHVTGPIAGISTYYCERCGALVQLDGGATIHPKIPRGIGGVVVFHLPAGSPSTQSRCVAFTTESLADFKTLEDKIREKFFQSLLGSSSDDDDMGEG